MAALLLNAVSTADAQAISADPATTASPQIVTSGQPRGISEDLASKLAASRPKFAPPPEAPKNPEELPDLRDTDKPRNSIIRLPKHIVQERKIPPFLNRDLLTPAGKLDLAYKRRPGLRIGSLGALNNNAVALFMLEEELRLERLSEMNELLGLVRVTDKAGANSVLKEATRGFLRSSEWIENGGSHGLHRAK